MGERWEVYERPFGGFAERLVSDDPVEPAPRRDLRPPAPLPSGTGCNCDVRCVACAAGHEASERLHNDRMAMLEVESAVWQRSKGDAIVTAFLWALLIIDRNLLGRGRR